MNNIDEGVYNIAPMALSKDTIRLAIRRRHLYQTINITFSKH